MQVKQVIHNLKAEYNILTTAAAELHASIALLEKHSGEQAAPVKAKGRKGKRKPMSKEARAKIAKAAKERWAKKRAEEAA